MITSGTAKPPAGHSRIDAKELPFALLASRGSPYPPRFTARGTTGRCTTCGLGKLGNERAGTRTDTCTDARILRGSSTAPAHQTTPSGPLATRVERPQTGTYRLGNSAACSRGGQGTERKSHQAERLLSRQSAGDHTSDCWIAETVNQRPIERETGCKQSSSDKTARSVEPLGGALRAGSACSGHSSAAGCQVRRRIQSAAFCAWAAAVTTSRLSPFNLASQLLT